MDDITPNVVNRKNTINQPIGCSTICVNESDCVSFNEFIYLSKFQPFTCDNFHLQEILAHTEDALQETLNHFYFVSAHIIEPSPQGKYKVRHFQMGMKKIDK